MNLFLENIFFFMLFGVSGVALEVFFTSLLNLKRKKDVSLMGSSSLWMFFIYGLVYIIVLIVTTYFYHFHIILRGLIYMVLILSLEFSSGSILKKFRAIPWDYYDRKYHFRGIVCLEFSLLWFLYGIIAEAVYLFFKHRMIF